jgi:hypothetical protein
MTGLRDQAAVRCSAIATHLTGSMFRISIDALTLSASYTLGAQDGSTGMSMACEHHERYDSMFERYFARGYNAGWFANR